MDLMSLTAVELGKKIQAKEVTVEEAVKAAIASIKAKEEKINSFVTIDEEGALKKAAEVQAKIDAGELKGALAGVPVAIKDNMCTEGLLTTCSSKILYNFIPTYTAEAVKRLEDAGCVIVGKTNMDEFAMGSTTETSAFGATKNPWNTEHVPGGSSGGSCAAVAAEEVPFALGSDTGGSIRQPSSFCGVTGIKPTYGTVSRYGLIAYGSSLDQIGPIAKDVTDCATILEAIASYDTKDSTSGARSLKVLRFRTVGAVFCACSLGSVFAESTPLLFSLSLPCFLYTGFPIFSKTCWFIRQSFNARCAPSAEIP